MNARPLREDLVVPEDADFVFWNVCNRPAGFALEPHFQITRGNVTTVEPSAQAWHADTIEGVRRFLPHGLHRLERDPRDDPPVVEVWL